MIGHLLLWSLFFVCNEFCTFVSGITNCSVEELKSCGESEVCDQVQSNSTSGVCRCLKFYSRSPLSNRCIPDSADSSQDFSNTASASAIAVGLLVPVISIVIIGGLIFAARRYRWVHHFRDQAHQLTVRNYDTVLVGNEEEPTAG